MTTVSAPSSTPAARYGAEQARLPRSLGLLNAISINMSNMVGTGPFITVPAILATMGGPQSLLAWLVGALLAIADGLVFAELGAAIPASVDSKEPAGCCLAYVGVFGTSRMRF